MNINLKRNLVYLKLRNLGFSYQFFQISKMSNARLTKLINEKIRFKQISYSRLVDQAISSKKFTKIGDLIRVLSAILQDFARSEKIAIESPKFQEFLDTTISKLRQRSDVARELRLQFRDKISTEIEDLKSKIDVLNEKFDLKLEEARRFKELLDHKSYINFLCDTIDYKKNVKVFPQARRAELRRSSLQSLQSLKAHKRSYQACLLNELREFSLFSCMEKIEFFKKDVSSSNFSLRLKISKITQRYNELVDSINSTSEDILVSTNIGARKICTIATNTRERLVDETRLASQLMKVYLTKRRFNLVLQYINKNKINLVEFGVDKRRRAQHNKRFYYVIYTYSSFSEERFIKRDPFRKVIDTYIEQLSQEKATKQEDMVVQIDYTFKESSRKRHSIVVTRFNKLLNKLDAPGVLNKQIYWFDIARPARQFSATKNREYFKILEQISFMKPNLVRGRRECSRSQKELVEYIDMNVLRFYEQNDLKTTTFSQLYDELRAGGSRASLAEKNTYFFKLDDGFDQILSSVKKTTILNSIFNNLFEFKTKHKNIVSTIISRAYRELIHNINVQKIKLSYSYVLHKTSKARINNLIHTIKRSEKAIKSWRKFEIFYKHRNIATCNKNAIKKMKMIEFIRSALNDYLTFTRVRRVNLPREISSCVNLMLELANYGNDELELNNNTIRASTLLKLLVKLNKKAVYYYRDNLANQTYPIAHGIDTIKQIFFLLQAKHILAAEKELF